MSGTLSVCPFASFEKCASVRMVSKASDAEDVTRIVASRTSDAAWKATSAVNDAASYGKTWSSSYVVCAASKPPFSSAFPTMTSPAVITASASSSDPEGDVARIVTPARRAAEAPVSRRIVSARVRGGDFALLGGGGADVPARPWRPPPGPPPGRSRPPAPAGAPCAAFARPSFWDVVEILVPERHRTPRSRRSPDTSGARLARTRRRRGGPPPRSTSCRHRARRRPGADDGTHEVRAYGVRQGGLVRTTAGREGWLERRRHRVRDVHLAGVGVDGGRRLRDDGER